MAPAVVIDLTSSPEPDDHTQKPSDLASFAPRKHPRPRKKSTDIWSSAENKYVSTLNDTPKDPRKSTAADIETSSLDDEGYHSYSAQNFTETATVRYGVQQAELLAHAGARKLVSTNHQRADIDARLALSSTTAWSQAENGRPPKDQGLADNVRDAVMGGLEARKWKTNTPRSMAARLADVPVKALPQRSSLPSSVSGSHSALPETSKTLQLNNVRKRPYSVASPVGTVSDAKHARLERGSRSIPKRRKIKLNDVTDHAQEERISYSEDPGIASTGRRDDTIAVNNPRSQPHVVDDLSQGPNMNGERWTNEEDALVLCLRDGQGLDWDDIVTRFNGRTSGAIQVRYSTIRHREHVAKPRMSKPSGGGCKTIDPGADAWSHAIPARSQRSRKSHVEIGSKSWKDVSMSKEASTADSGSSATPRVNEHAAHLLQQDRAFPSTTGRILRQRELGCNTGRAWSSASHSVGDELKEHVHSGYSLRKHYHGTSGDVISLSWNIAGTRFAAGSIAISDASSMQYNMPRNLVIGDHRQLFELADHHVPRPMIEATDNLNAQHSMRSSQDPRLFLSVTATAFSRHDATKLYTAGADKTVRHYAVTEDGIEHRYAINHPASVDLLTVGPHNLVASGCHQTSKNVLVFACRDNKFEGKLGLSPRQSDSNTSAAIFPSALKWGEHAHHSNFLLGGYSGDEEKQHAGETCLWDVRTGQQLHLSAVTRNVFDIAWNPNATSASNAFAVASNASGCHVGKGMRTVIQCFAPGQDGGRRTLTWECPALDINDVVFCPHDDNLIAAGATDGKVYVWDQRWAGRSNEPLHVLTHGESENVLSHDRPKDVTDTGVRFLSWGSTRSRLYTGSSDGIVKVWNPGRSVDNTCIEDIAAPRQHRSAVMSGAFSPDYRELLIGTENGRINLFEIGGDSLPAQPFKLQSAPAPRQELDPLDAARDLLDSGAIQIRPCGAMPFRQAVQGPSYAGPFLQPTADEHVKAEERFTMALNALHGASRRAQEQDEDDDDEVSKAELRVSEAKQLLNDLLQRSEHHDSCNSKAAQFQHLLLKAEEEREALLKRTGITAPCKLGCAVMGTNAVIEASRRSDLRIPGYLRWVRNAGRSASENDASVACPCCNPPGFARTKQRSTSKTCDECLLKQARLTSVCIKCSEPAPVVTDASKEPICESCSFACFRCGQVAEILANCTAVKCDNCDLSWEVGTLGYELMNNNLKTQRKALVSYGSSDELGDEEREYYASRWNVLDDGEAEKGVYI